MAACLLSLLLHSTPHRRPRNFMQNGEKINGRAAAEPILQRNFRKRSRPLCSQSSCLRWCLERELITSLVCKKHDECKNAEMDECVRVSELVLDERANIHLAPFYAKWTVACFRPFHEYGRYSFTCPCPFRNEVICLLHHSLYQPLDFIFLGAQEEVGYKKWIAGKWRLVGELGRVISSFLWRISRPSERGVGPSRRSRVFGRS